MIEIDVGNDQQRGKKGSVDHRPPPRTKIPDDKTIREPIDRPNNRIKTGDPSPTPSTPPPQHNKAHDRKIISRMDRLFAYRTVRPRPNEGLFAWQSIDDHIQEASDKGA